MPNCRFAILIRLYFSSRYYVVDIESRSIYSASVPNNEKGQSLIKLSVMEWRRVIYIFFCL